ncbi:MAG: PTS sugar transporter subunit IIA [Spirochaetaceae bacterium]|jgi:PTS system fructose-specific IIC component/PTS system nitrogen regulatory IIA component|nr:PTS sugar transporter subunit IIA [Spirochaetaceae bacterium]
MLLGNIYRPEYIKIGLEAEDKEAAFEELVDHFCQLTNNSAREEILDSVREREDKMSTGIKKGIGIPHGKTGAVDDVYGILGISKKGIEYDALDGEPVYIIFLMLTPVQDEVEKHLGLLKNLADLLEEPKFFTDLLGQSDAQSAYAVIKRHEDIRSARN